MGRNKAVRENGDDGKPHLCWKFNLNNYTEKDMQFFRDLEVKYLVYGEEVAPTTGTPHLEGYVIWIRNYRFAHLKKLHPKVHWEPALTDDCMNYCLKEQNYFIKDNRKQGERSDLKLVSRMVVEERRTLREIAFLRPVEVIRYHRGIQALITLTADRIEQYTPTNVIVIKGESGTGKSRRAREIDPNLYLIPAPRHENDPIWFDGYAAQKTILLDDFRGHLDKMFLLQMLDGYPMQVPIKGGFVHRNWDKVIITTNEDPKDWYYWGDVDPLTRRISQVIEI